MGLRGVACQVGGMGFQVVHVLCVGGVARWGGWVVR